MPKPSIPRRPSHLQGFCVKEPLQHDAAYFGAGIGILMLSALGLIGLGDIHRMNALKTLLGACINGVSVAVFVAERKVEWRYALSMAVAAIVGGYLGARVARRLDGSVVRWVVVLIGFGLAAHFFYKQWRPTAGN